MTAKATAVAQTTVWRCGHYLGPVRPDTVVFTTEACPQCKAGKAAKLPGVSPIRLRQFLDIANPPESRPPTKTELDAELARLTAERTKSDVKEGA